jgi:hypothetical protein
MEVEVVELLDSSEEDGKVPTVKQAPIVSRGPSTAAGAEQRTSRSTGKPDKAAAAELAGKRRRRAGAKVVLDSDSSEEEQEERQSVDGFSMEGAGSEGRSSSSGEEWGGDDLGALPRVSRRGVTIAHGGRAQARESHVPPQPQPRTRRQQAPLEQPAAKRLKRESNGGSTKQAKQGVSPPKPSRQKGTLQVCLFRMGMSDCLLAG